MMQSTLSVRVRTVTSVLFGISFLCGATLGFSAPTPHDAEHTLKAHVETHIARYDTLSTWICQGAVLGSGRNNYHDAINEARASVEDGFKTLILEKLNAHEFTDVMRIRHYADEYLTHEKSKNKDAACAYLTYPIEALQSLVPTLHAYVDEHVQRSVDSYIHHSAFAHALQLSTVYGIHVDPKRAGEWIARIRAYATEALELSIKKSVALKDIPALAMDERARAEDLIRSFPEHHEIRIHLERRIKERGDGVQVHVHDSSIVPAGILNNDMLYHNFAQ
jgi:hypothetical protein